MATLTSINGIPIADIAKINGVDIASIARRTGIDLPSGVTLPEGLIVPFLGVSTPDGWSLFSDADGRAIIGAGDSYAVAATGGETAYSASSPSGGAHGYADTSTWSLEVSGGTYNGFYSNLSGSPLYNNGSHTHALTGNFTPERYVFKLIKAGAGVAALPRYGCVFTHGDTDPSGGELTVYSADNHIFYAGSSTGAQSQSKSISVGSGGYHAYHSRYGGHYFSAGSGSDRKNTGSYSHEHTWSSYSLTEDLKRYAMMAWQAAAGAVALCGGEIALWESLTPPDGWYLCNGSNGTPDLRNYFIYVTDASGELGATDGSNRLAIATSSIGSAGGHSHNGGSETRANPASAAHSGTSGAHTNHTGTVYDSSWMPPYYALAFIMKAAA